MLGIAPWLNTPSRFETFLRFYHDKIRRKTRLCRDVAARHDLLAELAVAWLLLQERRFAVEYEKAQPDRRGGPDFTATFKTHTVFNVEVKRLRPVESPHHSDGTSLNKLAYAVCEKLRQLPPTDFNIIALFTENAAPADELAPALKQLKLHAERKDEAFFEKRGLSVSDFFSYYSRLHAIIVCTYGPTAPYIDMLWINKEARRTLPEDLQRTLRAAVVIG